MCKNKIYRCLVTICHPSIYRHPLYNAKCKFPQRWRYKGGGLYIEVVFSVGEDNFYSNINIEFKKKIG